MKRKIISTIYFLFVLAYCINAQIFTTKSSEITFFSEAPLENIEAVNTGATSMLNTATNDLVFSIPIIAFKFEKALMQEHFNENYMESDKFPKASFKGKINKTIDFTKDGTHEASVKGKLTIHGVEREKTFEGTFTIKDGQVILKSQFTLLIKDHDIKIPKVVIKNIAEEILVKVNATYLPYKKKSKN